MSLILFWVALIALFIILGAILGLTLFLRSNYSAAMKNMSIGKPKEALDLLMRVVGWQERHVPALWQVALLNLSMDKTEAAVRYMQRIINIMDGSRNKEEDAKRWEVTEAEVLSKLAWSLAKLNKRADAILYFQRLIEFEPKNKESRYELAKLLYSTRQYDLCIPVLESVIELDHTHLDAYETLSHALSAKSEHLRAAEVLSKRLQSDRGNVNLWIRLANLYRTGRDNAKQIEAWKAVMGMTNEHDPNYLSAMVQLGKIEYLEGNAGDAVETLRKSVDLCPAEDQKMLISVKYYLRLAYHDLDRKADARKTFAEVYGMDHGYKDVRDRLRESFELLSDEDLAEELKRMRIENFSSLAVSIVTDMGFKPTNVETINDVDVKVIAKLEETGKDQPAMLYFQRAGDIDVGELSIRTFAMECDEKHVEYPVYFSTGGFSFEAQLKAKDYRLKLMPKQEFCEMIRKVRTAV